MKKIIIRNKPVWIIPVVAIAVFLFISWPLLKTGYPVTDDGNWMAIRLSAFYQSLIQGQFPVRLLGRLFYNFGYPVANFLYPGYLYFGSVFQFFGFGSYMTVEILTLIFLAGGFWGAFIWFRQYFDKLSSFFGSLVYLTSPYLIFDVYIRGSIGEVMAISLAPYLFWATSGVRIWLLPWIIFFLILSHNSMMLLILLVFAFFIIYFKRWDLILPALLGFVSAAFFWLPAIYEQKYIAFNGITISDPSEYFFNFGKYMLVSIVQLISLTAFYLVKNAGQRKRILLYFLVISIFALFMSSWLSFPIWQFGWARFFQFPYRFLGIFILSSAFLSAYLFSNFGKKGKILILIMMLIGFYLTSWRILLKSESAVRPEGYYSTNEASTTVSDEYLPLWVQFKPEKRADKSVEVYAGDGEIMESLALQDKIIATVKMDSEGIVQINKIFYPGWGVTVNAIAAPINYDNPSGLIRFKVPAGIHKVFAEFRETGFRFMADILTVMGLIGSGYYSLYKIRRRPKI